MALTVASPTAGTLQIQGAYIIGTLDGSGNFVQFTGSAYPIAPDKGGTGIANNAASTLTISGSFGTTITVTGATSVTLPTAGTLATLAGTEALTNKTINGLTVDATTGTLRIADSKILTVNQSASLTGDDGATIGYGGGLAISGGKILTVTSTMTISGEGGSIDIGTGVTLSAIAAATPCANGTVTPVISITTVGGIITAIS